MTTTGELARALEECLEEMRCGGVDAAAAAARFPELASELGPYLQLAAELDRLPRPPGPTEAFRHRLAAELAEAPVPSTLPPAERTPWPAWSSLLRRVWRSASLAAAGAAAVIAVLASGAVYASAGALPGDTLYPVKRGVESARIWLADDGELQLYLDFADRRLTEALRVPHRAGGLLADFSRDVTAALVLADYRLAAGAPPDLVVAPLLDWLLRARAQLVSARDGMPPTAWRASLALVDEAISALQSEQAWSAAAVPRLADAGAVLRRQRVGALSKRRGYVARAPQPDDGLVQTVERSSAGARATESPSALGSVAISPGSGAPAGQSAGAAPPSPPTSSSEPTEASQPGRSKPRRKRPTATATAMTMPSATETRWPSPTAFAEPPGATEPPATPTPEAKVSGTPSPTPDALPTIAATRTPEPANRPPEISRVACVPLTVMVYGTALCSVDATDPDGDPLEYEWSVDWGKMENAAQRDATYQAILRIAGFAKMDVAIRVAVRDGRGAEVKGRTVVIVVPRSKLSRQTARRDGAPQVERDQIERPGIAAQIPPAEPGDGPLGGVRRVAE